MILLFTLINMFVSFIIGVVVACCATVKLLHEHSETGELLAAHFRITYVSKNKGD
jgi:hypothetical protein